jgi:hypothetical protein
VIFFLIGNARGCEGAFCSVFLGIFHEHYLKMDKGPTMGSRNKFKKKTFMWLIKNLVMTYEVDPKFLLKN